MKKNDRELLKQALGATSPFAFSMPESGVEFYNNKVDAYRDVLMMLWAEFPRGYIDIPFFMHKYQNVALRDAERICGQRQYAMIKLWDSDDKDRLPLLRSLLGILLKVTGVEFDENVFVNAVQIFDTFLLNCNVRERTVSGALVNFTK
jgi:hypothetical protein